MERSKYATPKILVYIFIHLIMLGSGQSIASEDLSVNNSIHLLEQANMIESKYTGEGGRLSILYCSFQIIASQDNAHILFSNIYNKANRLPGKIYSLMWLYKFHRSEYSHKKQSIDLLEHVPVMIGDIIEYHEVSFIISNIENGKIFILLGIKFPLTSCSK